jgi:tyrosyl-tRNA synthetase
VAQYHGAAAAEQAQAEFEAQFSKRDYAEVAETLTVGAGEVWIVELVEKTGKFKSRGDIRRLIQGGGVSLDGVKITDDKARVTPKSGRVLKAGKLVVVRLEVTG